MNRETAPELSGRILTHLQQLGGIRRGQRLGNVPYYLASAILERHAFDSIESLIVFCEHPDNTQAWLPNEADRVIFSDELVRRLREMHSDAAMASQTSVAMAKPQPLRPSPQLVGA